MNANPGAPLCHAQNASRGSSLLAPVSRTGPAIPASSWPTTESSAADLQLVVVRRVRALGWHLRL